MTTPSTYPLKLFVGVLVVMVVLAGCRGGDSDSDQSDAARDAGSAPTATPSNTPAAASADVEPERDAFVYAAVIEQLVTESKPGQGDPPFKVIFVLDGVVPRAAEPTARENPEGPFAHDLKDGLQFLATLSELPPLEFVPTRESALGGTNSGKRPGQARDGGAVISLGAIERSGRRVEVETSLWVNGLWGTWQTYVLAEKDGVWEVTGTTGPLAIS
jgi:hypothetical protein